MRNEAGLVATRFKQLAPHLDERMRRLWAAAEARALGFGGAVAVERSTGVSRRAIARGTEELAVPVVRGVGAARGRIRRTGGGRKKATAKNPGLLEALRVLVEPGTRGDPENALRWTAKSVRRLAAELRSQGQVVSHQLVAELLQAEGYSLQANAKTREGGAQPLDTKGQDSLEMGLRLANATWKSGQVHRAAWEGNDGRINPEKRVAYNPYDVLKTNMFNDELGKTKDPNLAFGRVVFEVYKDLIQLQDARKAETAAG